MPTQVVARRRVDGPTPLSLERLSALTRAVGREVGEGSYLVRFDETNRWSMRLSSDEFVDVWLIAWTRDQATSLHDHAGSLGALTVVSGSLTEHFWRVDRLRSRTLKAGRTVGFPVGYVHDVVNVDSAPAISVHAYSPPLTAMSYYDVTGPGAIRRTHSVLTDDPEPGIPTVPVGGDVL